MAKETTQRVTIRIVENADGTWTWKYCIDAWKTLPFTWPSKQSAERDLSLVIEAMLKRGYFVVDNEGKEVKPA